MIAIVVHICGKSWFPVTVKSRMALDSRNVKRAMTLESTNEMKANAGPVETEPFLKGSDVTSSKLNPQSEMPATHSFEKWEESLSIGDEEQNLTCNDEFATTRNGILNITRRISKLVEEEVDDERRE